MFLSSRLSASSRIAAELIPSFGGSTISKWPYSSLPRANSQSGVLHRSAQPPERYSGWQSQSWDDLNCWLWNRARFQYGGGTFHRDEGPCSLPLSGLPPRRVLGRAIVRCPRRRYRSAENSPYASPASPACSRFPECFGTMPPKPSSLWGDAVPSRHRPGAMRQTICRGG